MGVNNGGEINRHSYEIINLISMDVTEECMCSGMQSFSLRKYPDRHPLTNDMQTYGVKIITALSI